MTDQYKELRFFLSHAVALELQCYVGRLELPTVPPLQGSGAKRAKEAANGVSASTADAEWGTAIDTLKKQEEFVMTLQIVSNGELMHEVPLSTHTPSRYDNSRHSLLWEDIISFPIRYRDLAKNSRLVATVRDVSEAVVGSATLCLYDKYGTLKTGRQKLFFELREPATPAANGRTASGSGSGGSGGGSSTAAHLHGIPRSTERRAPAAGDSVPCCDGDIYENEYKPHDYAFRLEKARDEFALEREVGRASGAGWLDRFSLPRVEELVSGQRNPDDARALRAYHTEGEERLRRAAFLVIDLPSFGHPVIFEQKPYITAAPALSAGLGGPAPASAAAAAAAAAAGGSAAEVAAAAAEAVAGEAFGGLLDGIDAAVLSGRSFQVVADWELEEDNPVENKYRKLAHRLLRGLAHPELRPNKEEREGLDRVINSHLLGDHLRMEEKDLLWKFRHCLTDHRKALTKLLLSVDWSVDSEVAQVADLLKQWRERAPIDVSDALKLLGRERAFQTRMVRSFAVDTLRQASNDELMTYMLQLVQALRYEPEVAEGLNQAAGGTSDPTGDANADASVNGAGLRSPGPPNSSSFSPGGSVASAAAASTAGAAAAGGSGLARHNSSSSSLGSGSGGGGATGTAAERGNAEDAAWDCLVSPLARFLIERATGSLELANFLFWYLRVGLEDATHGAMYTRVWAAFRGALQQVFCDEGGFEAPPGAKVSMWALLQAQEAYVASIAEVQRTAREQKGRKAQKEEVLQRLLEGPALRKVAMRSPEGSSNAEISCVPLPLDPRIGITGLQPSSAFIFRSALYPCVVEFCVKPSPKPFRRVDGGVNDFDDHGSASREPGYEDVEGPDAAAAEEEEAAAANGWQKQQFTVADEYNGGPSRGGAGSYRVIVKSGDDLRQDQLIIQMVSLMDKLLKRVNLDLKLKPYRILATGARDGLVEFVADSLPVSAVLARFSNSILEFLRHYNPDPSGPYGVRHEAVTTFVRSCAGYCVITFILGIGDRHLDNLMLLPAGNLFHIDFGYIFGRDPKPMAPPFRLTREMVDAMGGASSPHYAQFCTYCCQAYNWLRKSASLILNLLSLMVDAGIEGFDSGAGGLAIVEDRFRLDLSDEQAEHFFLRLINDSLRALAPRVLEVMHQLAVARR